MSRRLLTRPYTIFERDLKQCCCNCHWLCEVMKHPENPISLGYGRMNERMGFACANPELSDPNQRSVVVFFVNGHGLCEGWTRQENQHVS